MSFEIFDSGDAVHVEVYLHPTDVDSLRVAFLVANWDGWGVHRLGVKNPPPRIPVADKAAGIALAKNKIIEIVQAGQNRIAVQLQELEATK